MGLSWFMLIKMGTREYAWADRDLQAALEQVTLDMILMFRDIHIFKMEAILLQFWMFWRAFFEIPHKLFHPNNESCVFYSGGNIYELLNLRTPKYLWNGPMVSSTDRKIVVMNPL